jgi:hypothetical protein
MVGPVPLEKAIMEKVGSGELLLPVQVPRQNAGSRSFQLVRSSGLASGEYAERRRGPITIEMTTR